MGSSSLNTHGISKRVIYSESVIKMLQHDIEKLNFSNGLFLVLYRSNLTKLKWAPAPLILMAFQKELYILNL